MPRVHQVGEGDCAYSIADAYKFRDWKKIYDAPDNGELKKARPDPNVLAVGDEIGIPDPEDSTKAETVDTTKNHSFKVKLQRLMLRVCVRDEDDKPIAGKNFRIVIGDESFDGTTDGDGIVEHRIPAQAKSGKLYVFFSDDEEKGEHLFWNLGIGHLSPNDFLVGMQQRLNNLGFICGDPDGEWHAGMDAAVRTFQKTAKLELTGELDDATIAELKKVHGKI